jgi:hypothetical protein
METNAEVDFSKIEETSKHLKKVLVEQFGRKYVEVKEVDTKESEFLPKDKGFVLDVFRIEQKNEPIYMKINDEESLIAIKDEIKEYYHKNVVDEYWKFLDGVEEQIDEQTVESMEMIGKSLQNRQKKLDSSLKKFKIEDSWNIEKTRYEFSLVLKNIAKDIIEGTLLSITNGMKTSPLSVYDDSQRIINKFLSFLGIYTKEYFAGEKFTDDDLENLNIEPATDEELKDASYKNVIRSVESLAYMFNEELCVHEATITVWRVS